MKTRCQLAIFLVFFTFWQSSYATEERYKFKYEKGPEIHNTSRIYRGSWEPETGYTGAVVANKTVYLSGIASNAETMEKQIHEIYAAIMDQLAYLDLDSTHIIKETIYTTDIEALKKEAELRKTFYPNGVYPAATWVQVERLYDKKMKIEIEIIAVRPEKQ